MFISMLKSYGQFIFVVFIIIFSGTYMYFVYETLILTTDPRCIYQDMAVKPVARIYGHLTVECKILTLNEVGDYFAGLMSTLAITWFAVAFIWQAWELGLQRRELATNTAISNQHLLEAKRRFDFEQDAHEAHQTYTKASIINGTLSELPRKIGEVCELAASRYKIELVCNSLEDVCSIFDLIYDQQKNYPDPALFDLDADLNDKISDVRRDFALIVAMLNYRDVSSYVTYDPDKLRDINSKIKF